MICKGKLGRGSTELRAKTPMLPFVGMQLVMVTVLILNPGLVVGGLSKGPDIDVDKALEQMFEPTPATPPGDRSTHDPFALPPYSTTEEEDPAEALPRSIPASARPPSAERRSGSQRNGPRLPRRARAAQREDGGHFARPPCRRQSRWACM